MFRDRSRYKGPEASADTPEECQGGKEVREVAVGTEGRASDQGARWVIVWPH